jgi:hypothetical protein
LQYSEIMARGSTWFGSPNPVNWRGLLLAPDATSAVPGQMLIPVTTLTPIIASSALQVSGPHDVTYSCVKVAIGYWCDGVIAATYRSTDPDSIGVMVHLRMNKVVRSVKDRLVDLPSRLGGLPVSCACTAAGNDGVGDEIEGSDCDCTGRAPAACSRPLAWVSKLEPRRVPL